MSPRKKKLEFWITCTSCFANVINQQKERNVEGVEIQGALLAQTVRPRSFLPKLGHHLSLCELPEQWSFVYLRRGVAQLCISYGSLYFSLALEKAAQHTACLGEKAMSCQEGQIRRNLLTCRAPQPCSCQEGELLCLSVPPRYCVSPSGWPIQPSCLRHPVHSGWLGFTRRVRTEDVSDVCT